MEEVQEMTMTTIKPMKPVNKLICVYSPGYLIELDRKTNPKMYEDIDIMPENQRAEMINNIVHEWVTKGCKVLDVADDCSDWAKTAKTVWFRPETLVKASPIDKDDMFLYINENFVIAIE